MENIWLTTRHLRFMTIGNVVVVLLLPILTAAIGESLTVGEIDFTSQNNQDYFYDNECPLARQLIRANVTRAVGTDRGLAAALLRLSFHDCFIRGCDASILLDSTSTNLAEKDGIGNAHSIRGFETIDAVKAVVENLCPGVVSCADIVAVVARDAIVAIGGPSWKVSSGRRDGLESHGTETLSNLPSPFANYQFLVSRFAEKGLTEKDMVVLSGGHTIGITHCGVIESRLYNSTGPDGVDPTLDADYAAVLKKQCPFGSVATEIKLDPTNGGNNFDSNYFTNVKNNKGIFISDAALITTTSGSSLVGTESAGPRIPFFQDFAVSMQKMSNIEVLTAPAGEIRRNCRVSN